MINLIDFRKALSEKHKDYYYDRYYPKEKQFWFLADNQTQVLILKYISYKKFSCLVIKSGLWYKKGSIVEIPIEKFPYINYVDGYQYIDVKIVDVKRNLNYEVGDILLFDGGIIGALVKVEYYNLKTYLHLFVLADNFYNQYFGSIIVMEDPNAIYRDLN